MPSVNLVAVLLAGISSMAAGFIWYGPLFGKVWMKLSGHKEMGDKSKMPQIYGMTFVGSLVTAYVLGAFLEMTGAGAMSVALWAWLGFQATLLLNTVLFEGKSWNLYFLNAAYHLVNLLVMSQVLSYFK